MVSLVASSKFHRGCYLSCWSRARFSIGSCSQMAWSSEIRSNTPGSQTNIPLLIQRWSLWGFSRKFFTLATEISIEPKKPCKLNRRHCDKCLLFLVIRNKLTEFDITHVITIREAEHTISVVLYSLDPIASLCVFLICCPPSQWKQVNVDLIVNYLSVLR